MKIKAVEGKIQEHDREPPHPVHNKWGHLHNCNVPHVTRIYYQLINFSEDGFVSLLTKSRQTKDDLKLPTDD